MHSLVGVGVDVTAVHRVGGLTARHGSRFLNRFLHPVEVEQAAARSGPRLDQFLASRWALKEAVLKACGSWRLPFPEMHLAAGEPIEIPPEGVEAVLAPHVKRTGKGPFRVAFSGPSADLLAAHRIQVSASLSHDDDVAFAVAIAHRCVESPGEEDSG